MARYIDAADVAKLVRKELKDAFPGVKFSVRTSKYAGGASIRVNYTDGPLAKAVEAVVGTYKGSTFNGMIDLKEYHDSYLNGETVSFGNDHIFVNRDNSDEAKAAMVAKIEAVLGEKFETTKLYEAFNDYDTGEVKLTRGTKTYGYNLLHTALARQDLYQKKVSVHPDCPKEIWSKV